MFVLKSQKIINSSMLILHSVNESGRNLVQFRYFQWQGLSRGIEQEHLERMGEIPQWKISSH